jgi:hypothetical protein
MPPLDADCRPETSGFAHAVFDLEAAIVAGQPFDFTSLR